MAAIGKVDELGQGIYGLTELHRYVAYQQRRDVRLSHVRYWAYHALNQPSHTKRRPDFTFHDLVSLFVVGELVAAGVRPHAIQRAESHLQSRFGLRRPFASTSVFTDGVDVLYEEDPLVVDQITAANRDGQEVLRPAIDLALRDIRWESGVAVAWDPYPGLEGHALVTIDPRVQFGEPCVTGTRIPTAALWGQVRSGRGLAEVATDYSVSLQTVQAAVEFEQELALLSK